MNRASPLYDLENLDLSVLLYYGRMWEEEGNRVKRKLKDAEKKR